MLRSLLTQRRYRPALACTLVSMAVLAVAPSAIAQQGGPPGQPPEIVAVDMSTNPQAALIRSSTPPADATVSVNGMPASVSAVVAASTLGYINDNVVIVDNSANSAPRLDAIKAAATTFVQTPAAGERLTVLSLPPKLEVGISTDVNGLAASIARLKPVGTATVYDAIVSASDLLSTQSKSFHSMTVIVASEDVDSTTTAAIARAEAINAIAPINVVALVSTDFPIEKSGVYQQLAAQTGGKFLSTDDPAQLAPLAAQLGTTIRSVHAVQFETDQATKGGNVEVNIGSLRLQVGFIPSTVTQGAALADKAGDSSTGLPFLTFFEGSRGMLLVVVLGAIAAALLAYSVALLMTKQDGGLTSVLQPYSPDADPDGEGGLSKNAIFQRAVDLTTSIAERQGYLVKVEKMLEQANMPLRAGEALTAYIGIIFGAGVLGLLLKQNLFYALIFAILGGLIPPAVVNYKAKRRRKKFVAQLPDTLQLLAGTLKAGYSFMQGVEAVSHEVEEPMGAEFRRVVTEAQLGRPVEEALEASALRMNSPDFEWAVMAVRIQREVGGNLSELLMTVAETMTARQRLRGEVQALTAEGRVSAMVLGILPLGLGAMLWAINPEYMNLLFQESIGRIMLLGSTILAGAGFFWMKKIIDIKI